MEDHDSPEVIFGHEGQLMMMMVQITPYCSVMVQITPYCSFIVPDYTLL